MSDSAGGDAHADGGAIRERDASAIGAAGRFGGDVGAADGCAIKTQPYSVTKCAPVLPCFLTPRPPP